MRFRDEIVTLGVRIMGVSGLDYELPSG